MHNVTRVDQKTVKINLEKWIEARPVNCTWSDIPECPNLPIMSEE